MYTVPSMSRKSNGVSMLITKNVKNALGCNLIACHCLVHQENLCVKSVKITHVITTDTKLVNSMYFALI
jgi:hypothetical protein